MITTEFSICYTWELGSDNMDSFSEYLKPTRLCDFAQVPEIRNTTSKLTEKLVNGRLIFNCICRFVKELPYRLEDWDVKASETLRKGWGMCSGKTNLLVAMSRSSGIPARYRISKFKTEAMLWKWVAEQDNGLAGLMGDPLPEQDHIMAEVYLDGWEVYDPSRDLAFEEGLRRLGIPLARKPVTRAGVNPQLIILASIDEWAQNRQQARRFRENRQRIFPRINKQLDKIRLLGRR